MNFLMVSNSCGRTLRELSMRKTRSTGPDLHFCSGPGEGNPQSSSRPWTSSHNALLRGAVRHFCCLTQQRSGITFTFPPHDLMSPPPPPPPPAFVIRFLEKHHLRSDLRQESIYWFQTFAAAFGTTFFLSDRLFQKVLTRLKKESLVWLPMTTVAYVASCQSP